jgi:ATP-dependent DNA ligase
MAREPLELKWVVNILNRSLAIGVNRQLASQIFKEFRLKNAWSEDPETLKVIDEAAADVFGIQGSGEKEKKDENLLGNAISPMLARAVLSIEDFVKTVKKKGYEEILLEKKFDGERVQIHFKKNEMLRLFSRNLESYEQKYSFLYKTIKSDLDIACESCVIDGEIVGVNKDGEEDFSVLQKLGRKTGDSEVKQAGTSFQIKVFDILFLNGSSVMSEEEPERKGLLKKLLGSGTQMQVLSLVESQKIKVDECLLPKIQEALDSLQNSNEEGFIAKAIWRQTKGNQIQGKAMENIATVYQPGKKVHWFKVLFGFLREKGLFMKCSSKG